MMGVKRLDSIFLSNPPKLIKLIDKIKKKIKRGVEGIDEVLSLLNLQIEGVFASYSFTLFFY